MLRPSTQLRAALQRTVPPLLVALAVAIVMIGKADRDVFASLRTTLTDDAAPALDVLSRPIGAATSLVADVRGFFMTYQDNLRLTRDNAELLKWQQIAMKALAENHELRGMLKVVPHDAVSFVTARVIGNSGGGFARSVMVDAGSGQGLARGQAAITGAGLVGRLTEVGHRAARILLLTDLNSRIPVVVERTHSNAVLAGDNSEQPRLLYISQPSAVSVGDRVVTSGEGGVFPPNLPVGVVADVGPAGPRVEPYVELSQLGHVLIVDYGLARSLPEPAPLADAQVRHGRAPPAEAKLR